MSGTLTVRDSKGDVKSWPYREVVEVKYLYAYRGGSLFQPVYLGKRDDVPILECLLSQLKFKAEPPAVAA